MTVNINDKELLSWLFDMWGIDFNWKTSNEINIEVDKIKVGGYSGGSVVFNFDKDGNFIDMDIWGG